MAPETKAISFTLNGRRQSLNVGVDETLFEVLRHRCGVRSIKNGCSPQGQCGACLVLFEDHPRVSCATLASKADGKHVLTLEGLEENERDLLARSFAAAAGVQCGFCIPGMALRAKWLVARNPKPERAEIARALDVHYCRCTGYQKLIDAIELYARAKAGEADPRPHTLGKVGESLTRFEAVESVEGVRPYVDDLDFEGMLFGAVVLSAHPRARVARIDTSRAERLPGVRRVATWRDVPGDRWYGLIHNDWPGLIAEGEEVRCVGDVLAAVAADDLHTAREAARLVDVTYEPLAPVLDPQAAIEPGAPQVNPRHNNLLSRTVLVRGDAEQALATSTHVASGSFSTQRIEHLFLELESCVAVPEAGERLHLYTQGQGIFDDRRQVASFLGLAEEQVFVELMPAGGAFGGKEDMSIQAHTALLATLCKRPVKIGLTREESVRMHPKRHPIALEYAVGCDAEGKLTAVRARLIGDSGAYASVGAKVLERAAGHACGPYRIPHVDIEAVAAYTNNPPCGAMRGFGVPQVAFALEACLDMLAEKAGIDRWELRWKNALEVGDAHPSGQVLDKAVGIKKTLQAVKPAYDAALAAGKAVGIACGLKNSGLGNGAREWGKACLAVESDGSVSLYNGFTEMGQGLFTILTQCAVEETGLDASVFRPKVDTTHPLGSGQTTGSRGTLLAGRAVRDAARKLRVDLDSGKSLCELSGRTYFGEVVVEDTTAPGAAGKVKIHTTYGFATQLCILDAAGKLERIVAAHDVGRALNPALCEGQIIGAVHMGLGYALSEELACEEGMPETFKLRELGVLRARDMPQVEVILIEEHEPEGPFGAKGVGEIGLVPTAAAVAGALAAFDGTRHFHLPMRNSPAARALSVGKR